MFNTMDITHITYETAINLAGMIGMLGGMVAVWTGANIFSMANFIQFLFDLFKRKRVKECRPKQDENAVISLKD